ncbi:sterol C-14 reductase [Hordeum vulgare]|nr:sterol C-14 reductase [Hordeum vulgare]
MSTPHRTGLLRIRCAAAGFGATSLRSPFTAATGMMDMADVLAELVPSWSATVVLASYLAYLAAAGAILPGKYYQMRQ